MYSRKKRMYRVQKFNIYLQSEKAGCISYFTALTKYMTSRNLKEGRFISGYHLGRDSIHHSRGGMMERVHGGWCFSICIKKNMMTGMGPNYRLLKLTLHNLVPSVRLSLLKVLQLSIVEPTIPEEQVFKHESPGETFYIQTII